MGTHSQLEPFWCQFWLFLISVLMFALLRWFMATCVLLYLCVFVL
jgi:hypothetical protein